MFRTLIALALAGGGIAALIKRRSGADAGYTTPTPQPATPAREPEPATPAKVAEARPDQPQQRAQEPIAGAGDEEQSVIPDTSADDPLVREQVDAARAEAGSIGGEAETVTADTDPAMRPVVEGSGDAPETFETTEEQGR